MKVVGDEKVGDCVVWPTHEPKSMQSVNEYDAAATTKVLGPAKWKWQKFHSSGSRGECSS